MLSMWQQYSIQSQCAVCCAFNEFKTSVIAAAVRSCVLCLLCAAQCKDANISWHRWHAVQPQVHLYQELSASLQCAAHKMQSTWLITADSYRWHQHSMRQWQSAQHQLRSKWCVAPGDGMNTTCSTWIAEPATSYCWLHKGQFKVVGALLAAISFLERSAPAGKDVLQQ